MKKEVIQIFPYDINKIAKAIIDQSDIEIQRIKEICIIFKKNNTVPNVTILQKDPHLKFYSFQMFFEIRKRALGVYATEPVCLIARNFLTGEVTEFSF